MNPAENNTKIKMTAKEQGDWRLETLTHVREEFSSIINTFEISNIFLQGAPIEHVLYDSGEKGKKLKSACIGICKGLRQEISAFSETVNLLESCISDTPKVKV